MPASTDALSTIFQFTSPITADVPMVAAAVCATVLMARTPAALNHYFQSRIYFAPFKSRMSCSASVMRPSNR